jgi:hypothetical protein
LEVPSLWVTPEEERRDVDGEASAAGRRWRFGRVAAWSGRRRRPASGAWLGAAPVLTARGGSGAWSYTWAGLMNSTISDLIKCFKIWLELIQFKDGPPLS